MSDQDKPAPGYESSLPQKPANLDSKVPIQMPHKCNAKPADTNNAGYYLNVAQKGKLILPTALWILLIIAGVSFITLLATLNKSINTLDELVEIEQEKRAAAMTEHFEHTKFGRDPERQLKKSAARPKKGAKKHEKHASSEGEIIQVVDLSSPHADGGWLMPIEASWFSMPSWTSLEPVRHRPPPAAPSRPMPPMGLLDAMMHDPHGAPDTIIIQDGPMDQPPLGLLNSFMKQLAPVEQSDMKPDHRPQVHAPPPQRHRPDHHVVKPGKPIESTWDLLANEMVEGLVEDALKQQQQQNKQASHFGKPDEPQIIIIDDTAPLAPGERPNVIPTIFKPENLMPIFELPALDGGAHKAPKKPPYEGDTFTLLFGAAPDSKLVFGEPKKSHEEARPLTSTTPQVVSTTTKAASNDGSTSAGNNQPATSELKFTMSSFEPTMSPEAKKEVDSIISQLPKEISASPVDEIDHKGTDEFFQDFMRPLFTLPQMSGNQQSASTNGSRPSSGSPGNSTRESMVCECQKTQPGSSSIGSSSSGGGGPNVGRSSSQSSGSSSSGSGGGGGSSGERGTGSRSAGSSSGSEGGGGSGSSSSSRSNESSRDSSRSGGGSSDSGSSGGSRGSGGSGGSSNSGGSSDSRGSGSSSGSSSGARSSSGSSSTGAPEPIGYVPVNGRPNGAPNAFVASSGMQPDALLVAAAQSQSNSTGQRVAPNSSHVSGSPVANARPGSLLSALNNNTNHLLPRLINRLNNTDLPKFKKIMVTQTTTLKELPNTTTDSPLPTTQTPKANNATTLGDESRFNSIFSKVIGFFKDQRPANQSEELRTTPTSLTTTPAPIIKSPANLTASTVNTPIVEVIEEQEALDQLPVIDLSPFAKSSKPFERLIEKPSDLSKVANASVNSTVLPLTGGVGQNSTQTTITITTSKPKVVTVSEADLDAEAHRSKSFLQKANDVLERQILGLKRFLNADKP